MTPPGNGTVWAQWRKRIRRKRAVRALERQLAYQTAKAAAMRGREDLIVAAMNEASRRVRSTLNEIRAITPQLRVLEVGSGAHGLIFCFGAGHAFGVDPLAVEYVSLFPWQRRARTIAAAGERLPFRNGSFDIVLCDNVVDHAEGPEKILEEMARVLAPSGLLYFTVNFHHGVYGVVSALHGCWTAAGIPFEITPFADHTIHLTSTGAKQLVDGTCLTVLRSFADVGEAKRRARVSAPRHPGDLLKRIFFKNALFEAIAVRDERSVEQRHQP